MPDSEKRESRGFARVEQCGNPDMGYYYSVLLDCGDRLLPIENSWTLIRAEELRRRVNSAVLSRIQAEVKKARREALEEASSANCQWCEMGWIVETFEHGSFHRVPPENAPTTFLNKKCGAHEIRRLIEGK